MRRLNTDDLNALLPDHESPCVSLYQPTGRIESGELADSGIENVLDDRAEVVLRMKGSALVVPAGRLPSNTGVEATYRY